MLPTSQRKSLIPPSWISTNTITVKRTLRLTKKLKKRRRMKLIGNLSRLVKAWSIKIRCARGLRLKWPYPSIRSQMKNQRLWTTAVYPSQLSLSLQSLSPAQSSRKKEEAKVPVSSQPPAQKRHLQKRALMILSKWTWHGKCLFLHWIQPRMIP